MSHISVLKDQKPWTKCEALFLWKGVVSIAFLFVILVIGLSIVCHILNRILEILNLIDCVCDIFFELFLMDNRLQLLIFALNNSLKYFSKI